jgi:Raf kinase inhibitor-like YbhB/YbcL family protein
MKFIAFLLGTLIFLIPYQVKAQSFILGSKEFIDSAANLSHLYNGYDCIGYSESPVLFWKNPPKGTKSFGITIKDLDFPSDNNGWWHWIVYDIPKSKRSVPHDFGNVISETDPPKGGQQHESDFGTLGYGGPCPPHGNIKHRYMITLYALDEKTMGLNPRENLNVTLQHLEEHTLGKATLKFYAFRN